MSVVKHKAKSTIGMFYTEEKATEAWNKRDENYDEGAFW